MTKERRMSIAEATREYTLEDLLALDDGKSYELVDGQLEELSVSNLASNVASRLNSRLGSHVEANQLGEVFDAEAYYRCFSWLPKTARKPDVSFISSARLPHDWTTLSWFDIAPDLVVEVLSPNDLAYKVQAKLNEYQKAGVRLVWIINPEQRMIFVHRLDGTANVLHEADELDGENVVAGFRCRVGDLFPKPALPAGNATP
jgi:Uma2 family endonuclease